MVSITLSVPVELKNKMDLFPEFNWSEIARQAITKKIAFLEEMNKIFSKSELTEEDAIKFGKELNKKIIGKIKM